MDGYGILLIILGTLFYEYYLLAKMIYEFSIFEIIKNWYKKTLDKIRIMIIIIRKILNNDE